MSLPDNVLRPSPADWRTEEPPAPGFGVRTLAFPLPGRLRVGAHLEELPPGRTSCPLHYHLLEEEHFLVLEGTLTVRELPDGGDEVREYPLEAGELVAYPGGTRLAHQCVNRGDVPARFLAVSDVRPGDVCVYPASGKVLVKALPEVGVFGPHAWGAGAPPEPPDAAARIVSARERARAWTVATLAPDERPEHVTGPVRLEERELLEGELRFFGLPLARKAGAQAVFVNRDRLPPGSRTTLHWHARDEEYLVVLAGRPTLRQVRGHRDELGRPGFAGGGEERVELRAGDLVHWSPDELVAHHLLNDAGEDAVLLVVGDANSDDVCLMPDRGDAWIAPLERAGHLVPADYWAGEEAVDG